MNASKDTVFDRLWARVDKGGPDDCWPWMGYRRDQGHGQIGRNGRLDGTHRVAWESVNGPVPVGLVVRHSCDNPPCCNPAHLLIGTNADNTQDAVDRGRVARKFRLPQTRLNDEQVRAVRDEFASGAPAVEVAERYGITAIYVRELARRLYRKDVA